MKEIGDEIMTKYIDNVNIYLSKMKIKQTYISLKTGIDKNKLSRILTGTQDVSATDMEKIANALGKRMEFFLNDTIRVPQIMDFEPEKISFYAGEPTEKQEEIADKLLQLMENIDEVMSAKYRFLNISEE